MLTRVAPIAITSGIIPLATSYYRSRALQKPDSRNFSIMSTGGITSGITFTILAGRPTTKQLLGTSLVTIV